MYRGSSWQEISDMMFHQMQWGWMLVSLFFGILPQVLRGLRWRMALEPAGEKPRRSTCVYAIFVSYAASLVIPRIGEITRCGTLAHYDGTSFVKSLGTVVTERVVDAVFMILVTVAALVAQHQVFATFFTRTGTNLDAVLAKFTGTKYLVAIICVVALVALIVALCKKFNVMNKLHNVLHDLWVGIISLEKMKSLGTYLFYSVAIWVCYYLQFSLTLYCFDYTSQLSPLDALSIFCAGSYAVLVPTPNGAGPWHFAVKTMLVLFGVSANNAILFALVVHATQTALLIVLGVVGLLALQLLPKTSKAASVVSEAPDVKQQNN